jgi:hypothetical protein
MGIGSPSQWLSVGLPLQLTLPGKRGQVQCPSTLLGWKVGAFLISELPFQEGRAVEFRSGAPCIVRSHLSGTMVGYRSEIRRGQFSPEPLLFLSFPTRIEQVVLRRHPRIRVSQPVSLMLVDAARDPAWPSPLTGMLQDLSVAGCRLTLLEPWRELPKGGELRLDFELPGVGTIVNLSGLVRNVVESPGRLVCGVEFQFGRTEYVEVRSWGATVRTAIEQFVAQRDPVLAEQAGHAGGGR